VTTQWTRPGLCARCPGKAAWPVLAVLILAAGCERAEVQPRRTAPVSSVPAELPRNADPIPRPERDEVAQLRQEVGPEFIVEACPPFVIAGKLSRERFDRFRKFTVAQCRDALWKDFFAKRPDYTIRIYLLNGKKEYERHARRLFNERPCSPFGYYVPSERRMVMDIGTGGGTLVHEMTHALMEPDFPNAPKWFSEGLASLFEQCAIRDGSLVGLTNWRLPALQEAIEKQELTPLDTLIATTDEEFSNEREAVHYAEARYLCMYMQEKGLLVKFYKQFRDSYDHDPTGAATLRSLLGQPMPNIETRWVKWVRTLKW